MPENSVRIRINGQEYEADKDESVLSVARKNKIEIPSLCYVNEETASGNCRICLVEVERDGRENTIETSCTLLSREGLRVLTDTPRVIKYREMNMELLKSGIRAKMKKEEKQQIGE